MHDVKFDGYRVQLHKHNAKPKAFTRRVHNWSNRFDDILSEFAMVPSRDCIVDGEAVVQDESGRADFGLLQDDLAKGGSNRIIYFAFDLLYLDDSDLRGMPLVERKKILAALIGQQWPHIRFSEHVEGKGAAMFKRACELRLEGIVSKRA